MSTVTHPRPEAPTDDDLAALRAREDNAYMYVSDLRLRANAAAANIDAARDRIAKWAVDPAARVDDAAPLAMAYQRARGKYAAAQFAYGLALGLLTHRDDLDLVTCHLLMRQGAAEEFARVATDDSWSGHNRDARHHFRNGYRDVVDGFRHHVEGLPHRMFERAPSAS